jgi:hypothetical protein
MQLEATQVPARQDGVPVLIRNPEGASGVFHITLLGRTEGRFDTFSKGLDEGLNKVLFTLPPGPVYVGCFLGHSFDGEAVKHHDLTKVTVTDPDGFWVSDQLSCQETAGFGPPEEFAVYSDPEQAVRAGVTGVLPTDEVRPAEYPDYNDRVTMLVARGGEPLANVEVNVYQGQARVHFGEACVGSSIADA